MYYSHVKITVNAKYMYKHVLNNHICTHKSVKYVHQTRACIYTYTHIHTYARRPHIPQTGTGTEQFDQTSTMQSDQDDSRESDHQSGQMQSDQEDADGAGGGGDSDTTQTQTQTRTRTRTQTEGQFKDRSEGLGRDSAEVEMREEHVSRSEGRGGDSMLDSNCFWGDMDSVCVCMYVCVCVCMYEFMFWCGDKHLCT
jgi:hypothetical protein